MSDDRYAVAFVCVHNAGRSQMATAFAERERAARGLADDLRIVTGGTDPVDSVHDVVVETMAEVGLDVSGREPRPIGPDEVAAVDLVITMGCSADDVCPAVWAGEKRDWGLDDPAGAGLVETREIRDAIESRVRALFDELFPGTAGDGGG